MSMEKIRMQEHMNTCYITLCRKTMHFLVWRRWDLIWLITQIIVYITYVTNKQKCFYVYIMHDPIMLYVCGIQHCILSVLSRVEEIDRESTYAGTARHNTGVGK